LDEDKPVESLRFMDFMIPNGTEIVLSDLTFALSVPSLMNAVDEDCWLLSIISYLE
jgi:hypothetical protein